MKRKKFIIILLIILLILVIFIFVNKKILLKVKTTNLDNSDNNPMNNYYSSLENNSITESEYYDTTKLQYFVMADNINKILRINGVDYTRSDIKLRQYFQREEYEKNYSEVINVIILYNEAKNRNITIKTDEEKKIKEEIYGIKFQNEFLKNIQYSEEELKDNLFKIYIEYELVMELKIQIDQEIMSNNISIDNESIKFDTRNLYELYENIKLNSQTDNSNDLKEQNLYKEYREDFKKIQNEYLNYIKEKYEVEYL